MNIALVPAEKVPQLFSTRIKNHHADEKVFVTSMSAQFYDNPIIQNLAKYGSSHDTFLIDYFGHWHGIRPAISMRSEHREARRRFQQNFLGSYIVIGPPPRINFTNSTILNRFHIKAYAVGNKVLSLGGVNCTSHSYDFIDLMLDFESDKFVTYLNKFSEKNGNMRKDGVGEGFWLDDHNEVLIDYGRRNNFYGKNNKSVILDSLLTDLEKELESVTMSSTYIPYGKLDDILFRHVRKGHPVTFYANRPSKFYPPEHATSEKFLQRFYALKAKTPWSDKRPDKFNHLKAAIITYPSGDRVAYVGSHNFNELHVWAGNAEMTLRTTDNRLIDQLQEFITDNLEHA
ncbi:MAG TPA: phospholipase D-like domain-containing protein [Candidatus Saccharimonadales bacterium]